MVKSFSLSTTNNFEWNFWTTECLHGLSLLSIEPQARFQWVTLMILIGSRCISNSDVLILLQILSSFFMNIFEVFWMRVHFLWIDLKSFEWFLQWAISSCLMMVIKLSNNLLNFFWTLYLWLSCWEPRQTIE